jgi:hypothetical protein
MKYLPTFEFSLLITFKNLWRILHKCSEPDSSKSPITYSIPPEAPAFVNRFSLIRPDKPAIPIFYRWTDRLASSLPTSEQQ